MPALSIRSFHPLTSDVLFPICVLIYILLLFCSHNYQLLSQLKKLIHGFTCIPHPDPTFQLIKINEKKKKFIHLKVAFKVYF